jgi:phosphoribosylamine--glycine ligase
MRILGVGTSCDLGSMYLRLRDAGHEVRVYVGDPEYHGVMRGLLERVDDWRAHLAWVRDARNDGLLLFETADHGAEQDALRARGYRVVGGCAFGDRLENDREFGQRVLAGAGLATAPTTTFDDCEAAIAFIEARPRRYVFKLNGSFTSAFRNYVGVCEDGSDVVALLRGQAARLAAIGATEVSFVLMDHLEGVETGVGAYFNGRRFLEPACLDWEHKRFFPGDLGELTGEMGTLVTYRDTELLFSMTLEKLAPCLRAAGYVGYVNLNTIIDERGIWPLELTCRFGYPGYAILDALQRDDWASVLEAMLDPTSARIDTRPGFAVGVVLTVPPFPYRYGYAELSRGLPIAFHGSLTGAERARLHFAEVAREGEQLVTSGVVGYVMVANGVGETVEHARADAYALARKVFVPNVRYRTDIGEAFMLHGQDRLRRLGYLP